MNSVCMKDMIAFRGPIMDDDGVKYIAELHLKSSIWVDQLVVSEVKVVDMENYCRKEMTKKILAKLYGDFAQDLRELRWALGDFTYGHIHRFISLYDDQAATREASNKLFDKLDELIRKTEGG